MTPPRGLLVRLVTLDGLIAETERYLAKLRDAKEETQAEVRRQTGASHE